LGPEDKNPEETLLYIKCMTQTPDVPPEVLYKLTNENIASINNYINSKHTATWFRGTPQGVSRQIITAELIYYWMSALSIPFECEHWHLSRLLTLIRVANEKQSPQKGKQNKRSAALERSRLNAERKARLGTTG
jgi:hypothetical protein